MSGVTSNLYPPIIASYMPAFIRDKYCRVWFSLSNYNSYNDVRMYAQVSIKNQNNNSSVLDTAIYPSGIKICNVQEDIDKTTDDRFYIDIPNSDIQGGFALNQYYKVQIRFTNNDIPVLPVQENGVWKIDSWLAQHTAYFSEWSTVCLIRGISAPNIQIMNFEETSSNNSFTLAISNVDLVGNVSFQDGDEETLKSYRIRLYDDKDNLLTDSGIVYSNSYYNINEINYTLNYALVDGNSYTILLDIITRNLYTEQKQYSFMVFQGGFIDKINATINAVANDEKGCITVSLDALEPGNALLGSITIRRSSSRTNYTIWEDVHTEVNNINLQTLTWSDYSIESGVWYKYCAQKRNHIGQRGVTLTTQEPVMSLFEDMFLVADGIQLRIKYDQAVSSLKQTILESKVDTIGSKFPFIRRNGYVNYRQMPISGLITFFDDEDFYTRDRAFEENINQYNKYLEDYRINEYNDGLYEREYREKVINFLYADNVKLFKTLTEGNLLVKLMDINLTPKTELGRYIYSFSANAYEIDENTLINLNKYNVQMLGDYSREATEISFSTLGQIQQVFAAGPQNDVVLKLLAKKYKKEENEYLTTLQDLTFLRIECESDPYLIQETSTGPVPITSVDQNNSACFLGYIVYINDIPIVIDADGIYELRGKNILISSVYFPIETTATINYEAILAQTESARLVSHIVYDRKIGQCAGIFNYTDSVFLKVWNKYRIDNESYYRKLISINGVNIEATPGTIVWIKDSLDSNFERHIINDTGNLQIYDDNFVVEGLYFGGIHLTPSVGDESEYYSERRYVNMGIPVGPEEIKNPVPNGVYILTSSIDIINGLNNTESQLAIDNLYSLTVQQTQSNTNRCIYYHGQWYLFTDNDDILCPVEALVDYDCDIMRGEYLQ